MASRRITEPKILGLDFETFFDPKDKYSLRSKGMSTSLYIRDARFEAMCLGYMWEDDEFPRVLVGEKEIRRFVRSVDWKRTAALAHHAHFDGLILSHHFNARPVFWYDTLSMARALHGAKTRADLGAICDFYGIQNKLFDLVKHVKGLHLRQITGALLSLWTDYCRNDVWGMWHAFRQMRKTFPANELELIDMTVKMFTDPVIRVDRKLARQELRREQEEKTLKFFDAGVDESELQSAEQFAELLRKAGVEPPTKISVRTGLENYAFAKTDRALQDLRAHEDDQVRDLVEARLAAKSGINESRAQAILDRSQHGNALPIYLNFAKAQTLRWTGGDNCLVGSTQITVRRNGRILCIMLSALQTADLVWDGKEFVVHAGLIYQGMRQVITYDGITATPDHKVFCEESNEPVRLSVARRKGYHLRRMEAPSTLLPNCEKQMSKFKTSSVR